MFHFTFSGGTGSTTYVNVDAGATPTCADCGGIFPQLYNINHVGPLYCLEHAQARAQAMQLQQKKNNDTQRLRNIASAIGVLFESIAPERRRILYRALSTVFHPDQGGETDVMAVLNSQRDRYRSKG